MALNPINLKCIALAGESGTAFILSCANALRARSRLPSNIPAGARLAHFEYRPAIFASLRIDDTFAWLFINGAWRDVSGDLENFPLHEEAGLLNAVTFGRMFPNLPPLPRRPYR